MQIIETQERLSAFLTDFHTSDTIIIPMFTDHRAHPAVNELYLIYVYMISHDTTYILPINTDDCINIDPSLVSDILTKISNNSTNKYVLDKKIFHYIYNKYDLKPDNKYCDIRVLEYVSNGKVDYSIVDSITTSAHSFIYYKFYRFGDLNATISVSKHIERLELLADYILSIVDNYKFNIANEAFKQINNVMINVLFNLENSGMYVDDTFKRQDLVKDNLIYGEYNLFTLTNRPSCTSQGYSFSSINKTDGSRKPFVSRFGDKGELVMLDYHSYHIYLIADIIGETFTENPHSILAQLYLGKDTISEEEYEQCKEITFNILYGGVPSEFTQIPFFKKVDKFVNELWNAYNSDRFIFTKYFKRKLYKDKLTNMNPQKLFNYYLQALETENNMNILNTMFNYIDTSGAKSKVILYIYDAILIDFNLDDGKEFMDAVIQILEYNNRFPVGLSHGKNYHDLVKI